MDMWTNPNMKSFMAVTAHWIEGTKYDTGVGVGHSLRLRSELAGFIQVPVRHTGEHLYEAFMHITERLHIKNVSVSCIKRHNTYLSRLDWVDHYG